MPDSSPPSDPLEEVAGNGLLHRQPAHAAKEAAGVIPVVFVAVGDPIAAGLVPRLAYY